MNRYGLKIKDVGLDFPDKASRDKALLIFTNCNVVRVNPGSGVVYSDCASNEFSVYDRNDSEVLMRCKLCEGIFTSETCTQRSIPAITWDRRLSTKDIGKVVTECVCDGCAAALNKQAEQEKARRTLNVSE